MFIRGLRNVPFSTVVVLITFLAIGFCEHQKFIKSWVKEVNFYRNKFKNDKHRFLILIFLKI